METDLNNLEQVVAFAKMDGKVVVLLYDHGDEVPANISIGKQTMQTTLPARKLVALEIDKAML